MTAGVPRVGRRGRARALVAVLALAGALGPLGASAAAAVAAGPPTPSLLPTATSECTPEVVTYVEATPPALTRLGAAQAWDLATGAGVVVAVVDSGVDTGNVHLTDAVLPGVDLVEGTPAGHTDTAGHGTAIAGQIAARPDERSGVIGLAPGATILPVRVYVADDDQARELGTAPRTDRIAEGIRYAVDNGARVINVSISSTVDDPALREAVRVATERGALVVASAGNRNTAQDTSDSPRYPAAYDEVLAVAALDDADRVTDDSIHGAHVDVAAPGTNVLTTYHAAGDCMLAGGEASTSFATAYVSAAAALLVERFPDETPAQWAHRLEVTAARYDVDARDDRWGWGAIRPALALAFVDDGSAPGPPSPVHEAPPAVETEPQVLGLGVHEDALAPAQDLTVWWVLGVSVVCVGALLASRLTPRRARPRPSAGKTGP
ncbi:S8 family serine peptidase [Actinotalea subterranea]|uniref:S8 family serine peptidase n=1 Tax=Actinotalea subterranea TaxID=2607497 RepID=UPI0011EDE7C1|nr:S8 family serine peptidase [Actinotalea subterranea]